MNNQLNKIKMIGWLISISILSMEVNFKTKQRQMKTKQWNGQNQTSSYMKIQRKNVRLFECKKKEV